MESFEFLVSENMDGDRGLTKCSSNRSEGLNIERVLEPFGDSEA